MRGTQNIIVSKKCYFFHLHPKNILPKTEFWVPSWNGIIKTCEMLGMWNDHHGPPQPPVFALARRTTHKQNIKQWWVIMKSKKLRIRKAHHNIYFQVLQYKKFVLYWKTSIVYSLLNEIGSMLIASIHYYWNWMLMLWKKLAWF